MDIGNLKSEIKRVNNKWYFKIPVLGRKLREKSSAKRAEDSFNIIQDYITKYNKEEFDGKSKEEQYELIGQVVNGIVDDVGIYTRPNWKKICEKVRSELNE